MPAMLQYKWAAVVVTIVRVLEKVKCRQIKHARKITYRVFPCSTHLSAIAAVFYLPVFTGLLLRIE